MSATPSVENDAPPCDATTASGTPCQKRLYASSDGEFWPHAGGHWFMPDDVYACLIDGHYDAASVLTHGPLVHLDVPCTRVTPPAVPDCTCTAGNDAEFPAQHATLCPRFAHPRVIPPAKTGGAS